MTKFTTVVVLIIVFILFITPVYPQQSDHPISSGSYLNQSPPGMIPEIFAPGIISTGKEHSAAMFSPDGSEIWFGRMFPNKIYYMQRIDDIWSEPQVAPFCNDFNYLYPVLTSDGTRIFFTSDRPIEQKEEPLSRGNGDIWVVEKGSNGWSGPKHLNENINFSSQNSCGSIATNGNIYFTARTESQSADIFCSQIVNSEYILPENLTQINSSSPDHCPYIAPDESYLIFSSFRGGQGRSDLFICFHNLNGTWTNPLNMGPVMNSMYKDEYPLLKENN